MMANSLLEEKLRHLDVKIKAYGERVYIDMKDEKLEDVINALNHVSGLFSYSLYTKCNLNMDEIKALALETFDKYHKSGESFKIEARRTYKRFELDSMEIMKEVSAHILRNRKDLIVDVHNPDLTINIEIREDGAYVLRYCSQSSCF